MDATKIMDIFIVQLQCIGNNIDQIKKQILNPSIESSIEFKDILAMLVDCKLFAEKNKKKITEISTSIEENKDLGEEWEKFKDFTNFINGTPLIKQLYNNIYIDPNNFDISFKSEALMYYFDKRVEEGQIRRNNYNGTYEIQTALINICRAFESFCSEIIRAFYLEKSESKELLAKSITYDDVLTFASIDDIKCFLVDEHIDSLFRGSFSSWFQKISGILNIDKLPKDEIDLIDEAFQRRNLYVHANGKVNQYYLKNVKEELRKGLVKDDQIETTLEYINQILSICESFAWWIFYKVSLIIFEGYESSFDQINEILLRNLKRNSTMLASIYKDFFSKGKMTIKNHKMAEVNYFLFYKMNSRISEVESELEKFDVNGCAPEFDFCKCILQDDKDIEEKALKYFDSIEDEEVLLVIYGWPILSFIKDRKAVKKYYSKRVKKILER